MPLDLTPNQPPYYQIVDGPAPAGTLIYTALMTQTSTNAPVATILQNTIGSIVWTRADVGYYQGTLTGAFPANRTWAIVAANPQLSSQGGLNRENDNVISLETAFEPSGGYGDGLLLNNPIEIRIYPA